MNHLKNSALVIIWPALITTILTAADWAAADWTRFRGPNGTGVSPDIGLPKEIDLGKNLAWSIKAPPGNSSPIVVDGRLYLTAHEGDRRLVLCFDAATGKQLWRKSLIKMHAESFNPLNGPTTPTPTSDGDRLFVFFPDIGLLAFDRDGKELWRTSLGPFASIQGIAVSPVYVEGNVVLLIDTPDEAYLASFAAATGLQVWKVQRPTNILGSYTTPTLYMRDGEETQIVVAGAEELTGYRASTGERVWWARGVTTAPAAPPFILGDSVYTVEEGGNPWPPFPLDRFDKNHNGIIEASEYGNDPVWARQLISIDKKLGNGDKDVSEEEYRKATQVIGGGLIRTRLGGKGDVSESHVVWRHLKGTGTLAGPLLYQNILYLIRNGIVSTFDPESGKMLRQERVKNALGEYYASPVAADGKVYLISLDGKVTVLKAGADWRILSSGDLGEQAIATPAIAGGCIYFRTAGTLFCFGSR
ncbi:MAG: PQQ-binding-like beta-propeller repeat protein [Blastocatellia bacterium]|nr:PQQ-binding-like beta-propeller repeat protein [Blastocatellia bacterium]